jgi:hypothetical protein
MGDARVDHRTNPLHTPLVPHRRLRALPNLRAYTMTNPRVYRTSILQLTHVGGPLRRNYRWTVQHAGRHKSFPDWASALTYANQQSLP